MRSTDLEVCGQLLAKHQTTGPVSMRIRTKLKGGQFHTTWWPASQITIKHHKDDQVVFTVPRWLAAKEALNPNLIVPPLAPEDKTFIAQLASRLFYIEERVLDQALRRHSSRPEKGADETKAKQFQRTFDGLEKKAKDLRSIIAAASTEVQTAHDNFPFPVQSLGMLKLKVVRIETAVKNLVRQITELRPPSRDDDVTPPPSSQPGRARR